ncbi:hypothetical protein BHE74_00010472 [Ensete ventricosum]|nr:hypothetical protein GW17_00029689 [Ensete ventricosum]RWW81161.1 hypothetical protein BHE74_00010472 [Ensete ventricosum]RZR90078.1 hypothetical protein BHM03_00017897 [Ensete ventricosum]
MPSSSALICHFVVISHCSYHLQKRKKEEKKKKGVETAVGHHPIVATVVSRASPNHGHRPALSRVQPAIARPSLLPSSFYSHRCRSLLSRCLPCLSCPRLPLPTTIAGHHRSSLSLPRHRLPPLSLLVADILSKKGQSSLILSHLFRRKRYKD